MMRILFLILCTWVVTAPAAAQNASTYYDQGVAARRAGDPVRAVDLLGRAVRDAPGSADARVQYGYALLSLGRLREADSAFSEALRLAPAYDDARVGRALVAEREGSLERARSLIAPIAAENEEATALRRRLTAAVDKRRWALDADAGATRVGDGQPDWRQLNVQLGYRADNGVRIAGRMEAARRFDRRDVYAEVLGEVAAGPGTSIYLIAGATPSADFRPRWQLGVGGRARLRKSSAPTVLTLDARHADYRSGRITLINPGLEQYVAGGRAWVTLRSLNLISDDKLLSGALGRVDLLASDELRLFVGAANAPEIEQGIVSRSRSMFAGAAFEISPVLTLRLSVERDRPTIGADRIGLSLGTTVGF